MADLGRQLELQRQINKTLVERQALLEKNTSALANQARMAAEVCKSLECKELEGLESRIRNINSGLGQTGEQARKAGRGMGDLNQEAKDAADSMDNFNKNAIKMGAAIGFIKGFRKSMSLLKNVLKGAVRLVGSFVKSVFNIGKAIISIPFKILSGLIDMSSQMGSPAFLQGLEEVRKTLGDIGSGPGKAVKSSLYEMRREMGGFANEVGRGNISFGRMFGYGPEGMAAGLKFNMELVNELGGAFTGLTKKLKGNWTALAKYRRGLGITASAQALMILQAEKSGKDIMKFQKDFADVAIQMEDQFGYSSKEIGITMGKMFEDVKNFGSFTKKELGAMSVASKKLGIDMKALVGVIGAFDDFDKAAENVASLNRNFGMMIDLDALHAAEDPVKRIQMLQKAFKATGLEVEKMGRREVAELASRSGMTEQETKILYARNNLEMDYNKIQDVTNKKRKKELTTAQVLQKLVKQIDKVFGSGSKKYKGFFDALGQGFTKGVRRSTEFRGVLRNLRKSLRLVDRQGQVLGRNFVRHFPGVSQLLGALRDFFNPAKIGPAMREINKHFMVFFQMLQGGQNTRAAVEQLGQSVMGVLRKFFGGKGEALDMFKQSFDTIVTLYGNIKMILLERSIKAASMTIHAFTDGLQTLMRGGSIADQFGAFGQGMGDRFGVEFVKLFNTIRFDLIPAIKRAVPVIAKGAMMLMQKLREYMWKNRLVVFNALKDVMIFVFKMKWEFLKFAVKGMFTSKEGFLLGIMLAAPMIAGAMKGMLGVVLARSILPWMAAKFAPQLAMSMVGSGLLSPAAATAMKGAVAKRVFGGWGTTAAASASGGFFASMKSTVFSAAAWGRGFARVGPFLKGAFKVAGPIGALITAGLAGWDFGTALVKTKGGWGRKLKYAGRALSSSLLSSLTLGFVSKSKISNWLFGPNFEEPIRESMYNLGRSSDKLTSKMGKTAAKVHDVSKKYQAHATAIKRADATAQQAMRNQITGEDAVTRAIINSARDRTTALDREYSDTASIITSLNLEIDWMNKNLKGGTRMVQRTAGKYTGGATTREAYRGTMRMDIDKSPFRRGIASQASEGASPELKALLDAALASGGIVDFGSDTKLRAEFMTRVREIQQGNAEMLNKARENQKRIMSPAFMIEALGGWGEAKKAAAFMRRQVQQLEAKGTESAMREAGTIGKDLDHLVRKIEGARSRAFETNDQKLKMITAQANYQFRDYMTRMGVKEVPKDVKKLLEAQARQIVTTSIRSGNMRRLATEARQIGLSQQKAMGDVVGPTAQQAKLESLEAAAETVARIQALAKIPEQLRVLEKKLGSMSEERIKKQADKLVGVAKKIAEAMNDAVKAHGMGGGQTAATMSAMIMAQLESFGQIRELVGTVIDKPIPNEAKQSERINLLKYAINQTTGVLNDIGSTGSVISNITKAQKVLEQLSMSTSFMSAILTAIPKDIKSQVSRAESAMSGIRSMITQLDDESISGKKIKGVVDLAKAINKGGQLTVTHSVGNVNAKFIVYIDSRQLGQALVATVLPGNKQIQTRPAGAPDER